MEKGNFADQRDKQGSAPEELSSPFDPRSPWIWLPILTILALWLRIIGLNQSLWWDEINSVLVSIRHPFSEIVTVFPGDSQHTLYSLLARVSILAFGEHAWSLRLPAVIFGVASIPILYLLGVCVTSRTEALLSAAFLSVSYHHVWFSQNARGYSALAFWTLLSTYFLLRGILTGRRAPFAGYAVAAALGAYTHLTMIFLIATQLLICAWLMVMDARRGQPSAKWRLPMQAFLMTGGLILLLYSPIVLQVQNFFVNRPSGMRAVSTPRWAFWETLRGLTLGLGTEGILAGAGLLVACGAWSYFKQGRMIFALFALPGAVTALGALLARGTMYPRFYFYLIGFAILILVRGVSVVSGWIAAIWNPRFAPALKATFATVLLAASAFSLPRNYRYPKQDFEGAIQFIDVQKKDGDIVITIGPGMNPFREYYGKPWDIVGSAAKLEWICRQRHAVWVVFPFPRYQVAAVPAVMELIHRAFTAVRVFPGTLGDGELLVERYQPGQRT